MSTKFTLVTLLEGETFFTQNYAIVLQLQTIKGLFKQFEMDNIFDIFTHPTSIGAIVHVPTLSVFDFYFRLIIAQLNGSNNFYHRR